jgi:uncharacterized damage-inducible protein DinB
MFLRSGSLALHRATHESLDVVFAHAATLSSAEFVQPVPAFDRKSIRDQLVHIVSVERVWIRRLQGRPLDRLVAADYPTIEPLIVTKRSIANDTVTYINGMDDATFNQTLMTIPPEWVGPVQSPAFIINHIVTHTFHHKGQVASMFRMLNHLIGDTDLQRL